MIVSITFVISELDGCGAGASVLWTSPSAGESPVCISPAKAAPERAHARAIANTKRFISGFSFGFDGKFPLQFLIETAILSDLKEDRVLNETSMLKVYCGLE